MTISVTKPEVPEKPQDSEVVLSVQGVSKKFCRDLKRSLFYGVQDIASELVGRREKSEKLRKKEFWALKDVSFEVRRGEALGLVGANGSGKTTLMRIIAGLIRPDTGSVEIKGRVAPLIALGAGFNPILTGRENIYANMSILGLSKQEIDERFDDVVEFAEIGDAIDAPVQTYSSGMRARLGFASAIHTEPDILLIDEVLAVGDAKFRAKCHRKLQELQSQGSSFILVSHMSHAILNVCDKAIYISKGDLISFGDTFSVMNKYEEELFGKQSFQLNTLNYNKPQEYAGLEIIDIHFQDCNGCKLDSLLPGEETYLNIGINCHKKIGDLSVFVVIKEVAGEGEKILHLSNFYDRQLLPTEVGQNCINIKLSPLCLNPGFYVMNLFIKEGSIATLDSVESFRFKIDRKENQVYRGKLFQPRHWQITAK